jgi:aspartoacylase
MVVGGTHGNERNAPWLLEFWRSQPQDLASQGLGLALVLGNPGAHAVNRRYLERDLNRSFDPALWAASSSGQAELVRARELVDQFGPAGLEPCSVVLDLHSTTSSMGNSLVVYGRRPADLALAAGIQGQLGLPIYLHEADGAQTGFLVERWVEWKRETRLETVPRKTDRSAPWAEPLVVVWLPVPPILRLGEPVLMRDSLKTVLVFKGINLIL